MPAITRASVTTTPTALKAAPARSFGAILPKPLAHLTPRPSGPAIKGPATLPVPILMYHVIAGAPAGARNFTLYVPPRSFIEQLIYLVDHDYHAVTLQKVYDFWTGKGSLPAHPIVLSFDDGYPSDFTVVAPLLDSLHWPGVLNLIAGRGPNVTRMPSAQVRAMIACGWEIDSHTVSHLDLPTLSPTQVSYELTKSRSKLRKLFGVPVNFFCYPSGRFNARVVAAVRAAGYLAATTTQPGFARPGQPFMLSRVRVSGGESLAGFADQLRATR